MKHPTVKNVKDHIHIPILLIACILLVVGVATNYWACSSLDAIVASGKWNRGLFELCAESGVNLFGYKTSTFDCSKADDQKEVKTLVVGGLFAACVVTAMMIFYAFLKHSKDSYKIMPKVCGIAGAVAAVAILLGLAVFGIIFFAEASLSAPGYSFYLTLVGAIVLIVGSFLSIRA